MSGHEKESQKEAETLILKMNDYARVPPLRTAV
jgi:hypothetical protein